jgi:hypothetical protein
VFWDTPRGDGMFPPSFPAKVTLSDLDRLFFIEGALTIFVALIAAFVLPDFPSTSHRWLSPIEVRLAEKRMEEDAGVGDEGQTEVKDQGKIVLDALTDWKVMYMALKYFILHISQARSLICCMKPHLYHPLPLIHAFFPTLTATLGYNRTVTLLLCAPPWVFATLVAFAVR